LTIQTNVLYFSLKRPFERSFGNEDYG
jgi:hypothetical protein